MNNHQVAVLAASMRTGGRTMNSVQDMLDDSLAIEQHLDQRDAQKHPDVLSTPGSALQDESERTLLYYGVRKD